MSARQELPRARLRCERLEERDSPSATPWLAESFDRAALGALPAGWSQWSNLTGTGFATENSRVFTGPNGFGSTGTSSLATRSWYGQIVQADFGVAAYA